MAQVEQPNCQNLYDLASLKKEIKGLQDIAQKEINIKGDCKDNRHTILLGNTGSGKSTIYCGLCKLQLQIKLDGLPCSIVEVQEYQNKRDSIIGADIHSQTKQIKSFVTKLKTVDRKQVIVTDTSGYNDTGNSLNHQDQQLNENSTVKNEQEQEDAGRENIKNIAQLNYTIKSCENASLVLVLELPFYTLKKKTHDQDAFLITIDMIPNLESHLDCFGIVINKSDSRYPKKQIMSTILKSYNNHPRAQRILQKVIEKDNIVILNYPEVEFKDEDDDDELEAIRMLDENYFQCVENLIVKLKCTHFKHVKASVKNPRAQNYIKEFIKEIKEKITHSTKGHYQLTLLKSESENDMTEAEKENIEGTHISYLEELNKLNQFVNYKDYDLVDFILGVSRLAISIGHPNNAEAIVDSLKDIETISSLCQIGYSDLKEIMKSICRYFNRDNELLVEDDLFEMKFLRHIYTSVYKQILQYTQKSIQKILSNSKEIYQTPEQTKQKCLLVARKKVEKHISEQIVDVVLSGNERYEETYYFINQSGRGVQFLEERTKIDEKNLDILRGDNKIFDKREEVKLKIQFQELLFQLEFFKENQLLHSKILDDLTALINSPEFINLEQQYRQNSKIPLMIGKGIIETLKVGVVEFWKMMKASGIQTITTISKNPVSVVGGVSTLGASIVFNTSIGFAKSYYNTEWQPTATYVTKLYSDVDLEIIDNTHIQNLLCVINQQQQEDQIFENIEQQ